MLSTTASYLSVVNSLARQQAATAANPAVKSATAHYVANIGKVKTVSQFVNDFPLFSYAMKAYGLGDMVYAKGLITKVLTQGVASNTALANTLGDPRYKAFAKAFNFAALGAAATRAAAATTETTSRYVEQTLETDQSNKNKGVGLALYFRRNASSISSPYGLLADPKMLTVVQTTFGISPTSGATSIDAQATLLGKVVKIADLQDPKKVEKLIERFTAQYDAANSGNVANVLLAQPSSAGAASDLLNTANGVGGTLAADSVLNLFSAPSTTSGISSDLLASLSKLRLGGV